MLWHLPQQGEQNGFILGRLDFVSACLSSVLVAMDVVCMGRVVGGVVFTGLGYVGHGWFKRADYNMVADHGAWRTCAGYT